MGTDLIPDGRPEEAFTSLDWSQDGLVPVVVQQHDSGEVLMVAYANRDALVRTLRTRFATFFSRSRGRLWVKGEESGHRQDVIEVRTDCDGDCLLYRVAARGPACHQLRQTCFSNRIDADGGIHCDRPVVG